MAWTPYIRNYKPFFIQTSEDSEAWGTEVYGLIAKSNPYPLLLNPKTPYKNDWKDENGDEEYVETQHFQSQELDVKFYCKVQDGATSARTLRRQIASFFNKIKQGEFSVYDDHTGIGFRNVRYAGYSEDSFTAWDNYAKAVLTIKFKVNDPMSQMRYNPQTHTIVEDTTGTLDENARFLSVSGYHPVFFQTKTDTDAWGTEMYGLLAKVNPYPVMPSPKTPSHNDWKDENGEDEYVATQFYQSQDIDITFIIKVYCTEPEKELRRRVRAFFDKIRQGEFLFFDEYTHEGRRAVRYAGYSGESFLADNGFAQAVFTIKLKANDPVTRMKYNPSTGTIVEDTSQWGGTAWIPFIRDYKPFYIQTEEDETAWGTESLGLIAKANPYPVIPSPKTPSHNDWKDEDGEDEFVTVQYFQSQEIDVKFFCKTKGIDSHKNLRRQIWEFFSRIRNGEFSIYDAHTGIGRRNVRYAGFKEDSFDADDNYTQTVFTVRFKINDPVTPMRYDPETNKIVEDAGGRDDLLGTESGSYIITENGLYIQAK